MTSLIICLVSMTSCFSQNLDGAWLSSSKNNGKEKSNIVLDFDTNSIASIHTNNQGKIEVNKKQTKIKADGLKGKLQVVDVSQNTLKLKGKEGSYTFKRIDSKSKIKLNKKELNRFLIDQFCDEIQGIKSQFTHEQFFLDKKAKKPHHRNQFINYTERDNGYWFIKKINGYAFLVLTTGKTESENIFQFTSLSLNGIKLNQFQNSRKVKNLTQLKTCL